MKNTIILTVAAMFLSAAANADFVGSISTKSENGWTVGKITNYPTDENNYDSWNYGKQGIVDAAHWNDDTFAKSGITPDVWAGTGDWVTVPKDTFQSPNSGNRYTGKGDGGYYTFNYNFSLTDVESMNYFFLSANVIVDNSLHGIYLNGHLLANEFNKFFDANQRSVLDPGLSPYHYENVFENIADFLNDGNNTLSFVVFNTPSEANPVGILMDGEYRFTTDVPPSTSATPEPATMLIFGLGIAGAAAVRRRMLK